ncbi:alpha/beta hydrolase [Alicyclobacillus shizuokensis]|uniref:alpha/beta hydrolase n=1 Tax=Alicyclobacillus shizuokensis TaxID=392014 RepID=UPI00083716F5|nr:alpha/beta hydrolase [Alicyclobacillus shizuokensis]
MVKLKDWHWPTHGARAVVLLVHGAGEHCGRYEWLASQWQRRRYAVLGTDLPGLGRSGGRRGHIDSFEQYLHVVDRLVRRADELYPNIPHILFGHSMGGLIVVRYLQTRPQAQRNLRAAVLSSPCLQLSMTVPRFKARMATVLDRVWPRLQQPNGIQADSISRSAEVVHAYANDPLLVQTVSVRWFMELQRAMAAATAHPSRFSIPVLILQAGADKLVSPEASRRFADQLQAPSKRFLLFEACYHELFNEPERELVFTEMVKWLDEVMATPPAEAVQR